jgi:hypothetical protein
MNGQHLTEFQIQQYLDGRTPDRAEIKAHLHVCSTCRENLEAYRIVYGYLSEAPDLPVTSGFRNRVLAQIRPARRFRFSFESGLSILFFLISMITVGYVTGFSIDLSMISGFFAGLFDLLPKFNIKMISDNFLFILVPLLIILVIELLDKKVLKLKY